VKFVSLCLVHSSLFLTHAWLFVVGTVLTTIHLGVFSSDGEGLGRLSEVGTLFAEWADAIFLALLVSTAEMGFTPELLRNEMARSMPNGRTQPSEVHSNGSYRKLDSSDILDDRDDANRSTPSSPSAWLYITCLVSLFFFTKTVLFIWAAVSVHSWLSSLCSHRIDLDRPAVLALPVSY
ncbi:unnamed protein product, partial [Dicrocoelium dendriticum]